jgi:16S rRNA (adenine(1408)-N(1))-methyltransferase
MFVVSAVENLPDELGAIAVEVRITFPWGSLLRGVVGADGAALAGIARIAKPGAEIRALFSITAHDGLDLPAGLDHAAYETRGMRIVEERAATRTEIEATHSSWAKRLRAGEDRPATLVRAVRRDA